MLSGRVLLRTRVRPTCLTGPDAKERPLSMLQGKRIFAFAGIARPDSFRQTIESLGGVLAGFRAFPDHHPYRPEDLGRIEDEAERLRADIVLTTEKDLVKLSGFLQLPSRLCSLVIETEILDGRERLEEALRAVLPPGRRE